MKTVGALIRPAKASSNWASNACIARACALTYIVAGL